MTKKDLKIVFFGTPDFAVESLRRLVEEGYNIAAVVTAPDKPAGRGRSLQMSAVKQYALEAGLPVLQPEKLKDPAFVEQLRGIGAQLFIVIAFRMLPEVVWTMPPLGTFNLHGSLLPRYRGAAPINRAVMNGDTRTGVTTFFLKHEIDTGDIIDSRAIEIGPDENAGSVYDRLMMIGADLTLETVGHIIAGDLVTRPQADSGVEATPAPKIFKDDCRIDWSRPAAEVHNLVRGLAPYPTAWSVICSAGAELGTLKVFETRLTVDCADCALEILSLQAPGKRRMPTADFLRGMRLTDLSLK